MAKMPQAIADFLSGKRSAPANAIYRKLRDSGHEVIPVNPNASELEGQKCYPDVHSVPGTVDAVMVATHPSISEEVARAALDKGVRHIWFHRSFGDGSVSATALEECRNRGVEPIEGGCPLMYCQPVDFGHRFIHWLLRRLRRVPS